MATQDFADGLRALGYQPEVVDGFVVIDYVVELGPLIGKGVRLAFRNTESFPSAPPGGPCVSPRLLPLTSEPGATVRGIHTLESVFQASLQPSDQWEYWSRPFQGWAAAYGVGDYMAHIRRLFDEISGDALQRRD